MSIRHSEPCGSNAVATLIAIFHSCVRKPDMLLRAARHMLIIVTEQQCKSRIVLWGAQMGEQSDGMKKEIDSDPWR